jgi:DNA invertase Pin-like site-specific DNA recombinase
MRAAIYARVSTFDQEPENQLQELRRYAEARGWTGQEYADRGVSGAKDMQMGATGTGPSARTIRPQEIVAIASIRRRRKCD